MTGLELKAVAEAAKKSKELLTEIYLDLFQPSARPIGEFIGEKVRERLAKAKGKPEDLSAPPKLLVGPAIMGATFAQDEPALRELYVNLLASAMNQPTAGKVHPAFAQIIQQLSPDEALILKEISKKYKAGSLLVEESIVSIGSRQESVTDRRMEMLLDGRKSISRGWEKLCASFQIREISRSDVFLRNLIRLGLLEEKVGTGDNASLWELAGKRGSGQKLKRKVQLTIFGDLFLDVCVRELLQQESPKESPTK